MIDPNKQEVFPCINSVCVYVVIISKYTRKSLVGMIAGSLHPLKSRYNK